MSRNENDFFAMGLNEFYMLWQTFNKLQQRQKEAAKKNS